VKRLKYRTYEQYLISVLEQEVKSRDETMKKARIKQAQFRQIKTLDTYNFAVMPELNKPKVISLTDGEYIRKKPLSRRLGNDRLQPGTPSSVYRRR